jgi:hypothetical protein
MTDTISFDEALKAVASLDRALLLGNGFSIAQGGDQFKYFNLLEKSGLAPENSIRKVFDALETKDFEIVMKGLEDAARVARAYGDETNGQLFENDAAAVRNALITAVHAVHPGIQFEIPEKQTEACAIFLKNFKTLFTLNYDLLLYWVILKKAPDVFKDGFGLGSGINGFRKFTTSAHCNTFYLHGALHLFSDTDQFALKRFLTGTTIIEDIAATIHETQTLPLIVAEGTSTQKVKAIRASKYLSVCRLNLLQLKGALFIFGHGVGDNDAHICDTICASKLTHVFFCVHEPDKNLKEMKERLSKYASRSPHIKWIYVDASTVKVWGT